MKWIIIIYKKAHVVDTKIYIYIYIVIILRNVLFNIIILQKKLRDYLFI